MEASVASRVVAIKPEDPEERGPIAQWIAADPADQQCLELPVGETLVGDPMGDDTNMNGPGAEQNPLTDVQVTATTVVPGPDCLWFIDEEG